MSLKYEPSSEPQECVVKLVEAGHPINAADADMQTPLLAASHSGPCGSNGKKV